MMLELDAINVSVPAGTWKDLPVEGAGETLWETAGKAVNGCPTSTASKDLRPGCLAISC